MKPPSSTLKGAHHRASSSINSLSVIAGLNATPSSKPPSTNTSPLAKRSATAELEDAPPTVSRVRRTTEQRKELLSADPYCGKLEAHLIECTKCGKSIKLGERTSYTLRPWLNHRKACDKGETPQEEDDGAMEEADDASTVAHSVAQSEVSSRKTEAERLAVLEADPRAEDVRSDEALCKKCQKWIRLSKKTRYALGNWNAHQLRCSDIVPSHRVAAAQSKLQIVNDSQAKSFTPRSVECKLCGHTVKLAGEGDYNLTSWLEHKSIPCISVPAQDSRPTDLAPTRVSPSPSSRPPPSTSSDTTLVTDPTGSSSVSGKRGTKRPREEEDLAVSADDDDEDLRPANRPRSEGYVPVQREAPSPWGWFLLPFKAFARGFRESLGSQDASG
ncbi:hypothetical protein HGRIS_005044 [Hohenbuehelia grisea]|uniref:Uncharacterized protein n=1 Tax=Hohenbuehelia grisea TaxID=104357 RepID=A0ABR3JDS9_9AGAR